jgi:DMSO/TMAO reductase YedYZ molybdopterin-dependent catalytic subunit
MMGGKHSLIGIWLGITVVTLVLPVSCSQVSPSPNIQSSAVTESSPGLKSSPVLAEIIPNPTTAPETPILTYLDLNKLSAGDPAKIDNSGFPITPVEAIHVTGNAQDVDIASYLLTVDGLVDNPLALSYQELLQFTPITKVVLLICPLTFVDNAEWTGVPVKTILTKAGIKPEANEVVFHSLDGYPQILSLQDAQKDGVFLAYKVNGQTLPKEHGYPLRLVREGSVGGSWIKWVGRIVVK